MSPAATKKVKLKVHLKGIIAYVPDGQTFWGLMPDALLPAPAQWAGTTERNVMKAHATHMGFLMFKQAQLAQPPTGIINTSLTPWSKVNSPKERIALAALIGEQIIFKNVPLSNLTLSSEVDSYAPHMKVISSSHQYADRRYLPTDKSFDRKNPGITAAFQMGSGTLKVGGYFRSKKDTDFGRVNLDEQGKLTYHDVTWGKRIANHLIWETELPSGDQTLIIENHRWIDKTVGTFLLKPIKGKNTIELEIMHSEVEIPTLGLQDPILPEGVLGLPDPDFEIIYRISKNQTDPSSKHVPIPKLPVGAGGEEKPCTGGRFTGFA